MVTIRKSIQTLAAALLMLCLGTTAIAGNIEASLDRQVIYDGESLTLTFTVNGGSDGRPDFSPLEKDFTILTRNKSSSMQFINGRMSSKVDWILTLMPNHKGKLAIPSIAFGKDRSNALFVVVKEAPTSQPGAEAEDIFLQVEAEPKQAHVQAQVVYTIRIYVGVNISNASLSEPKLSDADAVIERLGDDKRFETTHKGRHYQVVERRYAIFPQQSGKLKIDPIIFSAQVINRRSRFMDPFNFNQSGHSKRLQSRPIEIDIKPVPAGRQAGNWLPASRLVLQEHWPTDPPRFRVGEAVTRTLNLITEGLTAAQLPEIAGAAPPGFKSYPDQPSLADQKHSEGITGQRMEKIALIATKAGDITLPEIKINWWNTRTQRAEVATIPARKITVLAAEGIQSAVSPPKPSSQTAQQPAATAATDMGTTTPVIATIKDSPGVFWPWLSLALGAGWLSTLGLMWYQSRRRKSSPRASEATTGQTDTVMPRQAEQHIKQACLANDATACKTALLDWARARYPQAPPGSLTELANRLDNELAVHIQELNRSLYSQSTEGWQGASLWEAWRKNRNSKDSNNPSPSPDLAPLYPG